MLHSSGAARSVKRSAGAGKAAQVTRKMPQKSKVECHYGPTNTYILDSPLGPLEMTSCPKGLHSLGMHGTVTMETFKPDLSVEVRVQSQLYQDNGYTYKPAVQCVEWLKLYFSPLSSGQALVTPSICPGVFKDGSFSAKVWKTLAAQVGFGETISYGGLAGLCQNWRASRAVGQAMASNPLCLVVPCHRVLCSSGAIGNYHYGQRNFVKVWLLQYEKGGKARSG